MSDYTRNVPATEIKIGSQIVDGGGAVLVVTAIEPQWSKISFTMDDLMFRGIKATVSRNALVRVVREAE